MYDKDFYHAANLKERTAVEFFDVVWDVVVEIAAEPEAGRLWTAVIQVCETFRTRLRLSDSPADHPDSEDPPGHTGRQPRADDPRADFVRALVGGMCGTSTAHHVVHRSH